MRHNIDIIQQYLLLDELTLPELIKFARELKIKSVNKMNKNQLKESIEKTINAG